MVAADLLRINSDNDLMALIEHLHDKFVRTNSKLHPILKDCERIFLDLVDCGNIGYDD